MSNTNGFHPSSSAMSDSGINDTTKRISSINDNSITAVNKRVTSKNILLISMNEKRSMKEMNRKQKSIDFKKKHRIQNDSNNNPNLTKNIQQHSHSTLEHIPSTSANQILNTDCCHSCGECYGEMISCNRCQTICHLLCINPPLCKEDRSSDGYYCDTCRMNTKIQEDKNKEQKLILPFRFDPKKNLQINGVKKKQQCRSTLEQIKLPAASNGRSLVQPSGEIKFRATCTNKPHKHFSSSTSNCKRKRIDSSPTNSSLLNPVKIPNSQLDLLHRLFLSCQSEEFHGPSIVSNDSTLHPEQKSFTCQKYCFICRKSSIKHGPSIHCDYCPLTYHLDCLTPAMISLPLANEKWMCPNHMEPIVDRYLIKKKKLSSNQRVKLYHQYSQMKQNTIIQEFTQRKPSKEYLFSNTMQNQRLERIEISQIPKNIEEFYLKATTEQKQICEHENNHCEEEISVQTTLPSNQSSSAYDPCIWDILQAILDHIVDDHSYEFSTIESASVENDHSLTQSLSKPQCDTLETIDILLRALNEPTYTSEQCTIKQIDTLLTPVNEEKPTSPAFSLLIDLTQFHSSQAALIDLHSQHVTYIRKHVIWFGSSSFNDICLKDSYQSPACQYISERHACLYYDRKHNQFELLNYSEYGTIVNDLRYGLDRTTHDDLNSDKQENENRLKCSCLSKSLYQLAWDGPAQIEQGTVIQIGCHEFLFYRHLVQ